MSKSQPSLAVTTYTLLSIVNHPTPKGKGLVKAQID